MNKIYLAGGWFTHEEAERHNRVYNYLKNNYDVFNPRLMSSQNDISKNCDIILQQNINGIINADIVVVIYDGKDTGTIWESGFAYANHKPIIYYSETLNGKPFNLMLARTGNFASNEKELLDLLSDDNTYTYKNVFAAYKGELQ